MQLTFFPVRSDDRLTLDRAGDLLIVNGLALDFTPLPDGATLPQAAIACPWIVGPVMRVNGLLQIPMVLPHGANPPVQTLFPDPILVQADGPVVLPPYDVEPQEPA